MRKILTPADIQRWFPDKWSDIAGNSKVLNKLFGLIANGMCNLLLTGPSRTGKTRLMSLLIKTLCCPNRTAELNPCNACDTCRDVANARWEHYGLFRNINQSKYSFLTIDCEDIDKAAIREIRDKIDLESKNTIIFLDEILALAEGGRYKALLKLMDECQASWIGSTVTLKPKDNSQKRLPEAFLNRFPLKLGTVLPHPEDLKSWIKIRCHEWSIKIDCPEVVLELIIQKSECTVGKALHFLAIAAATDSRILNEKLVNEVSMDPLD